MALCEIHLNASDSLGKMTSFMAILPEGKAGPFAVLYLLHGLGDDHTAWARRTSLERYVANLPLIVVMPNGDHNWDYWDLHIQDTLKFLARELKLEAK